MKHPPVTQGLELSTDAGVADAWEAFFRLCWEWHEEVLRRRALRSPALKPPVSAREEERQRQST